MVRNKNFVLNYIMTVVLLILTLTLFLSFNEYSLVTKDEGIESIAAPTNSDNWQDNSSYRDTSWSGSGNSESDPYLITSANELAGLAYLVNAGDSYIWSYFKQTCDIDLSAHYWTPIGTSQSICFSGNYDGNGHTISGIYTKSDGTIRNSGLFGMIIGTTYDIVTVKNLGIIDSIINGYAITGGIVGNTLYVNIINCYNKATVIGGGDIGDCVGGIAGSIAGSNVKVKNCFNTGNISSKSFMVGGIAGTIMSSTVQGCFNTGDIFSERNNAGGIVGYVYESGEPFVRDCYNTGNVSSNEYNVGGIVGYGGNKLKISNCYNIGNISGIYAGGVIGNNKYYVANSYNVGDVTGTDSGGFIGINLQSSSGLYSNYFGGNCNAYYAIGYNSYGSYGYPSWNGATKISNLNSTSYAKGQNWYTTSSNWNSSYPWDFVDTWGISSSINDGYPYLKAFTYNIQYEYNGGSAGNNAPSTAISDEVVTISNPISPKGYIFTGWTANGLNTSIAQYGSSTSTTSSWTNGSTKVTSTYFKNLANIGGTVTLTANYELITYNITYDLGDGEWGSGAKYSNDVSYDYTFEVSNPISPTGHIFTGWTAEGLDTSTAQYGSSSTSLSSWSGGLTENRYFRNLSSTLDATVKFTATYDKEQYTIKFDAGLGTVSPQSKSVSYNETIDLPTPTSPTGYYFNGWEYSSSTYSGSYTVPDFGDNETTVTFTADYVKEQYTIKFDAGSGTVSIQSKDVEYNEEIDLPTPTPPTGYHFNYWEYSNSTYSGSYTVPDFGEDGTTVTFTANYSKEQYTVIFNAGTGTVSPQSKNVSYNETIDLPTPTPPAGYYFNGWKYSNSTYSGSYTVPDFGDNGTTVTFTAQYEKQLYTVMLDANGGTVLPTELTVTYLGTYGEYNGNTLPIATRQGYIFRGWYTAKTSNTEIYANTIYTATTNTTIYARWTDTWVNHVEQPEGQGSMSSPYLIKTQSNLAWIARQAMLGYSTNYVYKQVANLDALNPAGGSAITPWYPIGTETNPFTGTYYGNGYGIMYSVSGEKTFDYLALFGYTNNAKLNGIFCYAVVSDEDGTKGGNLVGYALGNTITNSCGVLLSVGSTVNTQSNGALIGYGASSSVRIENCVVVVDGSNGAVTYKVAGGSTTVKNCVYIINNKKGYIGTDFSNYTYLQGMELPLPKGLSWLAQGGKSCTLQDIKNWVNE